jgi:hypothetical protein
MEEGKHVAVSLVLRAGCGVVKLVHVRRACVSGGRVCQEGVSGFIGVSFLNFDLLKAPRRANEIFHGRLRCRKIER